MQAIPLSLYIHLPWCIRKCPYCDFNSHNQPEQLPEGDYIDALLSDLSSELPFIWGRRLTSIFIGGGTPSLFSAQRIDQLLSGINAVLPFRPNLEITLEANPGTFEQERFKNYRQAGINRLSIGIQSFNPHHLSILGRIHDRQEALRAADIARQAGFDNVNLDLMFGLPQQTETQAMQDLQTAVAIAPTHLSWYQLTLEPNTYFYKHPPTLPEEDDIAQMQLTGQAYLSAHRYTQYEVSAYAKPNFECRHNRNYWEFGDYIAIGAGAHGKFTDAATGAITRYQKYRQPKEYLQQAKQGQARSSVQILNTNDIIFEFMLNALRLRQGFTTSLFSARTGLPQDKLEPALSQAIAQGWLQTIGETIRPTEQAWLFLNEIITLFLKD